MFDVYVPVLKIFLENNSKIAKKTMKFGYKNIKESSFRLERMGVTLNIS